MPPESMTTSPEVPARRLGSWMPHRGVQVHPTMALRRTDDCSVARKHGPLQVPRYMRKDVLPTRAVKWHVPASKGWMPWTMVQDGNLRRKTQSWRGSTRSRWKHHHCRCGTVPLRGGGVPAKFHRHEAEGIHHTSRHNITRCELEILKAL